MAEVTFNKLSRKQRDRAKAIIKRMAQRAPATTGPLADTGPHDDAFAQALRADEEPLPQEVQILASVEAPAVGGAR